MKNEKCVVKLMSNRVQVISMNGGIRTFNAPDGKQPIGVGYNGRYLAILSKAGGIWVMDLERTGAQMKIGLMNGFKPVSIYMAGDELAVTSSYGRTDIFALPSGNFVRSCNSNG